MTHQQLHDAYFDDKHTQALKDYYLKTLQDRANNGSSVAKRLVAKIQGAKRV